jgi:cytochrome c oxidase assembly protein subunit 15
MVHDELGPHASRVLWTRSKFPSSTRNLESITISASCQSQMQAKILRAVLGPGFRHGLHTQPSFTVNSIRSTSAFSSNVLRSRLAPESANSTFHTSSLSRSWCPVVGHKRPAVLRSLDSRFFSANPVSAGADASALPVLATPLVGRWLLLSSALVFAVIVVGGVTRLTESGLSITEWRPITGVLPPLNAEQWNAEFEKYKATPEFKLSVY